MFIKQLEAVIRGDKTLTQRLFLPPLHKALYARGNEGGEALGILKGTRVTYEVGSDYAVSPGRGKMSAYVYWGNLSLLKSPIWEVPADRERAEKLQRAGHKQLRIKVLRITIQRLHDMTDQDVRDEGVHTREEYIDLWNNIHGSGEWNANPTVAQIRFERVIQLADGTVEPPAAEPLLPNMTQPKKERRLR